MTLLALLLPHTGTAPIGVWWDSESLFGLSSEWYGEDWVTLTLEQIGWLANLPIRTRREEQGTLSSFFVAEVYQAIIDAGYGALIPIDRRDWILPETSEGRSAF